MKLNVQDWKEFKIPKLFDIYAGNYYNCDDYEPGITPYVSASATNNGVGQMINRTPDFNGNKIVTGKVECKAFYQGEAFCATSDANVYSPKFKMTQNVGLFLTSIITFNENGKWSYGRQCRVGDTKGITIKLPIKYNQDKTPFIDDDRTYSDEGYVPDWQFMEDYIKLLHHKPITTKVKIGSVKALEIDQWEEFTVSKLFDVKYGINMELNTCIETTCDDPEGIAFIARTAENNGVSAYVKRIEGKAPQPAETITVAGGGSVLSTFVQKRPFYSGRDLYLLISKEDISLKVKIFISTVLFANQYRYSYGRQANKTLPDLILKLPIKRDDNGNPIIDDSHKYSDKGYIPDWQFMEDYINSLPYNDRI